MKQTEIPSRIPRTPMPPSHNKKKQSKPFSYWVKKNYYYHQRLIAFYRKHIPEGSVVLQINCKNGYLLHALKPSIGVGIDVDAMCIDAAQKQYPKHQFFNCSLQELSVTYQFDYIILPFITMQADDIQALFTQLHRFCHPKTRIIVESYSSLWAPVLWFSNKLGLRRPTRFRNWLSCYDLTHFLYLTNFEVITSGSRMLMPIYVPFLSTFANALCANLPLINKLCLHQWLVVRPAPCVKNASDVTVSVVITCKNEKGNIEAAVKRCPDMGKHTELIFVEGNSTDGTLEEIHRVAALYPYKDISILVQDGTGKGDAVRKGFAHARGDVLMILDGDLTMPPEQLPKFFVALLSGKGEFINGSRLVYRIESNAMVKFLGPLANWGFAWGLSWILGQRIKDTLCGTKVMWRKDYERMAEQRHVFGFQDPFGDFDLLFGAAKLNLKIVDIPVRYKRRTYGKTNIKHFKDVWFLIWMSWRALLFFKFW